MFEKIYENKVVRIIVAALGGISLIILIISFIFGGDNTIRSSEENIVAAAKRYFENNSTLLPKNDYETYTVSQNTLISQNYLENPKDKNGNIISCSSYVTVVRASYRYVYNPYIHCGASGDTNLLYKNLLDQVVVSGDGLYQINEEHYFKGENPNNFVSFGTQLWRIVKISDNKSVKMIAHPKVVKSGVWDNRYNTETKNNYGINDYSISRISSTLYNYFYSEEYFDDYDRSKVVFTDICVGKRSIDDRSIDGGTECSSKLENQPIALLQLNEYFIASNDSNCPGNSFTSCQNYNFLANRNYWSLTALKENSYQAFAIYPSVGFKVERSSISYSVLPTIVLKNDVGITGGSGTESDPYKIK